MLSLIRTISLRRVTEHRLRTAMTVAGVALGVAVLVAVVATNRSILASFRDTLTSVGGTVHLEVRGGDTGISEDLLASVRQVQGVRTAAVALQRTLDLADSVDADGRKAGEALAILAINFTEDQQVLQTVYGVTPDQVGQRGSAVKAAAPTADDFENPLDVLDRPRQIVVSERFAARIGKKKGDTVSLMTKNGEQPFTLYAVTKEAGPQKAFGGNLALMDYLDAQEVFDTPGRVDRIDVALLEPEKEGEPQRVAQQIKKALGGQYEVEPPSARQARQQQLLRTFGISLTVAAGIALMVGMFLIYHTLSISVAQRRTEIGILRATGATRRQIATLFTLEGAVFGLVGSVIGVVLGRWLAAAMMKQAAGGITDVYVRIHTDEVQLEPQVAVWALVLGVVSAAVAALVPAVAASRLSPVETIRTAAFDLHGAPSLRWTRRESLALGLLALAPVVAQLPPFGGFPWFGLATMGMLLLAASLLARWLVVLATRLLAPLAARLFGLEGRLAADNVARGAAKGAVTVASLMVGLSMVIASSTMTFSFQHSMDQWIEQAVPADLFVTSGARLGGIKNQPLVSQVGDEIAKIPGVKGVDRVRLRNVDFRDTRILLLSMDTHLRFRLHPNTWTVSSSIGDQGTVLKRMQLGEGVVVSETLAHRCALKAGDLLPLQTATGEQKFIILGTIVDYSSDQGAVFIDRALYIRLWKDELVDTFEPYLEPGADLEAVRSAILANLGKPYRLFVLTNAEFRAEIRHMIEQLFSVMRVLELVTVVISLLSVVNTLLTAILDRMREIGVLRAIGMLRRQLSRMILVESLCLALVGAALGLCVGVINGYVMLDVINKQETGWNVPVQVAPGLLAIYSLAVVVVGVLAAVYPARVAGRIPVVDALGYE